MRPDPLRYGAALLACLVLGGCNGEAPVGPATTAVDDTPGLPAVAAAPAAPADSDGAEPGSFPKPASLDPARIARQQQAKELFEAYACQTEQCNFEPLSAGTPEEASWLALRGYPTAARSEELERMSLNELELASERNDLAARAVLGRRLVEQGDKHGGMSRLYDAAIRGSIFADYQLSRVVRDNNMFDGAAYLRRAYLQGDTKAATEMYMQFARLSEAEWDIIDRRAMHLYRALQKLRASQGSGRLPYGPRP